MSCLSARVYRKVISTAEKRMDKELAGTIRNEIFSLIDEAYLNWDPNDFSWESELLKKKR